MTDNLTTLSTPQSFPQYLSRLWRILAACFLLLGGAAPVMADTAVFHTTAREMIRELNRQPQKYRSLFPKKRAIVVMETEAREPVVKTMDHDPGIDIPRVRVKILFDFNSSRLRHKSLPLLDQVGMALKDPLVADKNIIINGHADSDGPDRYNLGLSYRRALAVKQYLAGTCRVPPTRLRVRGYGESIPLVKEINAETKQRNRRVEFEVAR